MKRGVKSGLIVMMVCALTFCTFSSGKDYKLGLLVPMWSADNDVAGQPYFFEGKEYASAIVLALEQIEKDGLLPGHNLTYYLNDTTCDETVTLRALTYQIYDLKVSAIIGPGCSCATSARFAASFDVPMISYVSSGVCNFCRPKSICSEIPKLRVRLMVVDRGCG